MSRSSNQIRSRLLLSGVLVGLSAVESLGQVKFHQVEAFTESAGPFFKYAPVNFAGNPTVTTGGRTYTALAATGSASNSTLSTHASTVASRAYTSAGSKGFAFVQDIRADSADRFLVSNVGLPGTPLTSASQSPAYFARSFSTPATAYTSAGIGVSVNAWVGSLKQTTDTVAVGFARDVDATRRIDYMLTREPSVVMVNGAAFDASTSGLVWSSYNGLAVRGNQPLNPAAGPGKSHADLYRSSDEASYTSGTVAGYAAGLQGTALASAPLTPAASNSTVIRSLLMTGASKATGSNGPWTRDTDNNLSVQLGAGEADYDRSLSILNAGSRATSVVSGSSIASATVYTATQGWATDTIAAGSDRALVFRVDGIATSVTATLNWNFTQNSGVIGSTPVIDTSDSGRLWSDLDLQVVPLTPSGIGFTVGSALTGTGLSSTLSNTGPDGPDNVEHLYFNSGVLSAGYYAFLLNGDASLSTPFGFSYDLTVVVPEPVALGLVVPATVMLLARRRRQTRL